MKKDNDATELYKVKSGKFMGWRSGNDFFSIKGLRAGRFIGNKLYHDNGDQIGWIYDKDARRVGIKNSCAMSTTGNRGVSSKRVCLQMPEHLPKNYDSAWQDPIV